MESKELFLKPGNGLEDLPNWVIEKIRKENLSVTGFILPSGDYCVIRETNGNDEDILSNAGLNKSNLATTMFIANIVVYHSSLSDEAKGGNLTVDILGNLLVKDKAFILIASRIFSIGNEVKFTYSWPNYPDLSYSQDLFEYIWDYTSSEQFPVVGDELYSIYRITPYSGNENSFEFRTSSGKLFKFSRLSIRSEKLLLAKSEDDISINDALTIRGLEYYIPEVGFTPVSNYKVFTSRELLELRRYVSEVDESPRLVSELINPANPSESIEYPLFNIPSFFFPMEA